MMQLPTNIFADQGKKKTGRTSLIEPGELNILAEFVALDSTRILQIMKRDFIHYFFIQKMSWDQGHFRQPQLFVPLDSQHGRYLKATYFLLTDISNGLNTNIFVISVMMVQITCLFRWKGTVDDRSGRRGSIRQCKNTSYSCQQAYA